MERKPGRNAVTQVQTGAAGHRAVPLRNGDLVVTCSVGHNQGMSQEAIAALQTLATNPVINSRFGQVFDKVIGVPLDIWATERKLRADLRMIKELSRAEENSAMQNALLQKHLGLEVGVVELQNRKQANRVAVMAEVAALIADSVQNDLPSLDEGWLELVSDAASTAADEGMRLLWGRLIAGEMANPQSFSKRAVMLLHTLSAKEAKAFHNIAGMATRIGNDRVAIRYPYGGGYEVVIGQENQEFERSFYADVQTCMESGVLRMDSDNLNIPAWQGSIQIHVGTYEPVGLVLEAQCARFSIDPLMGKSVWLCGGYSFTNAGLELLRLVEAEASETVVGRWILAGAKRDQR